jgi:hypothetical protein
LDVPRLDLRAQCLGWVRRSFGHASYSQGLLQFLDIFEPTKYRFILKAGDAEKGIGLQDSIAS